MSSSSAAALQICFPADAVERSGFDRRRLMAENAETAYRMARSLLMRWHVRMPGDEIRSVSQLALCEAALRFDPDRGTTFSTFLFCYVKGSLLKEIAAGHSRSERYVLTDETDDSAQDGSIPGPDSAVERAQLRSVLRNALRGLDIRDREILHRHYANDESIAAIARDLGYSRGHTSRLKMEALSVLASIFQRMLDGQAA